MIYIKIEIVCRRCKIRFLKRVTSDIDTYVTRCPCCNYQHTIKTEVIIRVVDIQTIKE